MATRLVHGIRDTLTTTAIKLTCDHCPVKYESNADHDVATSRRLASDHVLATKHTVRIMYAEQTMYTPIMDPATQQEPF